LIEASQRSVERPGLAEPGTLNGVKVAIMPEEVLALSHKGAEFDARFSGGISGDSSGVWSRSARKADGYAALRSLAGKSGSR
jgi:hypothetical protein